MTFGCAVGHRTDPLMAPRGLAPPPWLPVVSAMSFSLLRACAYSRRPAWDGTRAVNQHSSRRTGPSPSGLPPPLCPRTGWRGKLSHAIRDVRGSARAGLAGSGTRLRGAGLGFGSGFGGFGADVATVIGGGVVATLGAETSADERELLPAAVTARASSRRPRACPSDRPFNRPHRLLDPRRLASVKHLQVLVDREPHRRALHNRVRHKATASIRGWPT